MGILSELINNKILTMRFLTKEVLKGFDKYKYSSKDTSPLSNYVMHPFWDWLVQFIPIWLAPNLMTFIGFLLTVINFLLLAYLDPDYSASNLESKFKIPSVIWLIVGIFNFVAHQLDGTDGKQARRTGTSSPLGELFDHGCDSWSVSLLPLTMISLFGTDMYGAGIWQMFLVVWTMIICFVLSHWEKYLTGILYLPWGYDFGQLGATIVCLATAMCSTNALKIVLINSITMAQLGIYCVIISVVAFSIPMTIYNISQSYRLKTGRMLNFSEAFRPLVSILILLFASSIWALFSPTDILTRNTRLFLFVLGTAASNITVQLIISQMSQTRSELINPFALAYFTCVLGIHLFRGVILHWELLILWIMCITFTIGQILSAVFIVKDLCVHLNIHAFSISYKLKNDPANNQINQ